MLNPYKMKEMSTHLGTIKVLFQMATSPQLTAVLFDINLQVIQEQLNLIVEPKYNVNKFIFVVINFHHFMVRDHFEATNFHEIHSSHCVGISRKYNVRSDKYSGRLDSRTS